MKHVTSKKPLASARLTITLGDDQLRWVGAIAREGRTSNATIIRQAVDYYIAGHTSKEPATRSNPR